MVFVEMRLNSLDLPGDVADMRAWLDKNAVETAGFSYREQGDCMLARIAFRTKAGPEAFAARFAGRAVSDIAASPSIAARRDLSDFRGSLDWGEARS
jgi:hypothetical protein